MVKLVRTQETRRITRLEKMIEGKITRRMETKNYKKRFLEIGSIYNDDFKCQKIVKMVFL